MRLFIAVDLSEELREKIAPILKTISELNGVKAVERENLHITLKFLGEVREERLPAIVEALKKSNSSRSRSTSKVSGFFPTIGTRELRG